LVALAITLAIAAPRVEAQTEDAGTQVERLAAEANNAYRASEYRRAVELLERAYAIQQDARLVFNLAKAYDKLGDQTKALDYYRRYRDSTDADPKVRVKAEARIAAYEEAQRRQDFGPSPEPHRLGPDRNLLGPVDFKGPPAETPAERALRQGKTRRSRARRAGIALMSLGGAALFSAAGLSIDVLLIERRYSNQLDGEEQKRNERAQAKTLALSADVLYGAAAIAGAVGAYYVWRGYHREAPPKTSAWIAPVLGSNGAGLVAGGSF
jgi:hypothetical protein